MYNILTDHYCLGQKEDTQWQEQAEAAEAAALAAGEDPAAAVSAAVDITADLAQDLAAVRIITDHITDAARYLSLAEVTVITAEALAAGASIRSRL